MWEPRLRALEALSLFSLRYSVIWTFFFSLQTTLVELVLVRQRSEVYLSMPNEPSAFLDAREPAEGIESSKQQQSARAHRLGTAAEVAYSEKSKCRAP